MTSSLSFPGYHPGFVMAPSHGFRLSRSGRLVASGSSELGAARSVHSVLSLRHILVFVRCELESPLVRWLTAACLGLLPSGLAIASLPLVSRPWTCLCWSHLMSLSSVSDRFVVLPRQLVGSGVFPCFDHLPSFKRCEAEFLRALCFGFASSLRDEVTLPG